MSEDPKGTSLTLLGKLSQAKGLTKGGEGAGVPATTGLGRLLNKNVVVTSVPEPKRVDPTKPVARPGKAKILFGIDLTSSRSDTIEQARPATAAMLESSGERVAVKLGYYRGAECKVSGEWSSDGHKISGIMKGLDTIGGGTQIGRLLDHAISETKKEQGINAVVFIGDHFEESLDAIAAQALKLKEKSVPVFVFHECIDGDGSAVSAIGNFQKLAELSGGAYAAFNKGSAKVYQEMLDRIAVYSTEGAVGLARLPAPTTPAAQALTGKLIALPPPGGAQ